MKLLNMAFKNVMRSKRRALRTFAVLTLGVGIFIFYGLLMDGMIKISQDSTIKEETSHIRIRENFDEDFPYSEDSLWIDDDKKISEIENIKYTERIAISSEIDNYENTLSIILMGIDEAKDSEVFKVQVSTDEPLADSMWLALDIANDMDVGIGDYVNVTFRNLEGTFISAEYEIGGLLNSSNPLFSKNTAIIDIKELKTMLGGDFISYYSIKLDDEKKMDNMALNLKSLYQTSEVLTWLELNKNMEDMLKMKDVTMLPFYLIILLITFLGLANSILISVWEKRKTTATLRALGYYDKEIIAIFIYEGLCIALIGTFLGILLGVLVNIPMSTIGYNYAAITSTGSEATSLGFTMYVPPVIKSTWNIIYFIIPLVVIPLSSVLISFIPARKSVKMSIVDCIKNKD